MFRKRVLRFAGRLALAGLMCGMLQPVGVVQADSSSSWNTAPDFYRNASTTTTETDWSAVFIDPESVTLASGYASVAVGGTGWGERSGYGIKTDGTLLAWGLNNKGQLGNGSTDPSSSPVQVGTDTNWQSVAGLAEGAVAIKADGTLWAWGGNSRGELGQGSTDNAAHSTPVQVGTDTNWQSVAHTHANYVLAIKSNGTLWAWGSNDYGELGLGDITERHSPTQVGTDVWKSVYGSGADLFTPSSFSVGIRTNGTLWAWGSNGSGQLGQGDTTQRTSPTQVGTDTNWEQAAVGGRFMEAGFVVARKSNGTLWGWGNNGTGELGLGDQTNRTTPVQIGSATHWAFVNASAGTSYAITTSGTLWVWGSPHSGALGLGVSSGSAITSPVQVGSETDWRHISAYGGDSGFLALGLKTDGTLVSWGTNEQGELGLGVTGELDPVLSPTQVGVATNWDSVVLGLSFGVGIKADGTLWAWGSNGSGELGQGDVVLRTVPTQVGSATNWESVTAGNGFVLAVRADGTLWSWGDNTHGQLGQGDTTQRTSPTQVGSATDWSAVATGSGHVLALKTTGTLWSWGDNTYGQLGQGDTTQRTSPTQVGVIDTWSKIASNPHSSSSHAIRANGTLWSWGYNNNGQLGLGVNDEVVHSTMMQVGSGTTWDSIHPGANHTLALQADNTLWTWGYNGFGQLGLGDTTQRTSPTQVGSDTNWQLAAGGTYFSAALKSNGTLWGFGVNNIAQLGLGDTTQRTSPTQVGSATNWQQLTTASYSSMAITATGTLWGWGYNDAANLGFPTAQYLPNEVFSGSIPASGTISELKVAANGSQRWGVFTWSSVALPANTSIAFRFRTSDDGASYSAYSSTFSQSALGSTGGTADLSVLNPSRYLSFELTLASADFTHAPTLTGAMVQYIPYAFGTGLPPGALLKPMEPDSGFSLVINQGAAATTIPTVTIRMNAG
ncbi:MAG: hypothetical protein KBD66_01495, partial [Candidatus Doudnabacteria bacterium]|nr:hypothetical protein [Candidatus Doudnabacteria bacterium]